MQQPRPFLMRGGLDLVTPPIAIPPGMCVAALNYESAPGGYRRIDGLTRYDGSAPETPVAMTIDGEMQVEDGEALVIGGGVGTDPQPVPGIGPVRGVWVYRGTAHAVRDQDASEAALFRAELDGWRRVAEGHALAFVTGSGEFAEGETVTGGTSSATARVVRVGLWGGSWSGGDAVGYLTLADMQGTFESGETLTGSASGVAVSSTLSPVRLRAGGRYEFVNHNFLGLAGRERMYFANGVQHAFEFDGATLSPVIVPLRGADVLGSSFLRTRTGGVVRARSGGRLQLRRPAVFPSHVSELSNHLFLAFPSGTLLFSGIGNPHDWRTAAGAGEIATRDEPTGFIRSAASSLVVFGRERVSFLVGTSAQDFQLRVLSDGAGGVARSMGASDAPIFLDAGGLRRLEPTNAFGNWRIGTLTERVEPIFEGRGRPAAAVVLRGKDQYRLYYPDGFCVSVYLGTRQPEVMPFQLPVPICCASVGLIGAREAAFIGSINGYVYEVDRGATFDGQAIPAFLRLAWNAAGAANQNKRFHSARLEVDAPDGMQASVLAVADYADRGFALGDVATQTERRGNLAPVRVEQGVVQVQINDVGRNLGVTIQSDGGPAHTITAATVYVTPRRLSR